jgi:hypothetical protein
LGLAGVLAANDESEKIEKKNWCKNFIKLFYVLPKIKREKIILVMPVP